MSFSLVLAEHAASFLATALGAIDHGVVLSDNHGRVVHVNAALGTLLGAPLLASTGLHRVDVLKLCATHAEDPAAFLRAAGIDGPRPVAPDEVSSDVVEVDLPIYRPSARLIRWTSSAVVLPDGRGRIDLFRDVTLEVERARLHDHLARTDALTGLLSRRGGDEEATREFARARRTGAPLGIAVVDLDHAAQLNELVGHAAVDRALQEIARSVVSAGRSTDVVSRWDGATLLVLLPGTGLAGARSYAERVRGLVADVSRHITAVGLPPVTVSVGTADLRAGDRDALSAIERAGHALRDAKDAGRNAVR